MLERLRLSLSSREAPLPLALLGIVSGLLAGGVIVIFRLLIESTQAGFLPGGETENFEQLSWGLRLTLAFAGALVVGLLLRWAGKGASVGVVHVMDSLVRHQGHLPLKNTLMQFIGGALCIISGQSVGREGPGVHLGAGSASLLGQYFHLPNNSIRTLVACGTAASIAASFNTPLAGVVFAMEVVMMEYTLASFTPVILAAVGGALLTRLVYGAEPAFAVPALSMASHKEMLFLLLMALVIGALAALLIQIIQSVTDYSKHWPIGLRAGLAGLSAGLLAIWMPQVMGIGYDTVEHALNGQLGLTLLLLIAIAKLVATGLAIGLALPGGIIGPTFVIGASTGGALGFLAGILYGDSVASPAFYALLGMGAMMGATLQAPLSALIAMLELTNNSNIILPGMLVVVGSNLVASRIFGKQSVFLMLLQSRGLDYRQSPVAQSLRSAAVASVMERSFIRSDPHLSRKQAAEILQDTPRWVIIDQDHKPVALLPAADLAAALEQAEDETIDLLNIPANRLQLAPVQFQSTLYEALTLLNNTPAEALYVVRTSAPGITPVQGVVTREEIEASYQFVN